MPDNLASERRAVRHKLVIFYGSHEPNKSSSDIDEIVDWTYHNGEQAINAKLKQKYKDDLTSVSVKAYVSLPLEAQLKAFYREFDPKKPESDLKEIVAWVNGRPSTGMEEINQRMEKKYGENLNTHAWGGRNHLRELLSAYFAMVDPSRNNPEAIQEVLNTVNAKGALWLERELQDRYRVMLPLAPSDMIPPPPVAMATVDPAPLPPRPKVKSLVASDRARPLSLALSAATMGPQKLTVSEDMEIRGIVEVYYAKHNPEKLTGDGVDQIMRFVRANGLEALNMKMRDKYGEDLDQLKVQYTAALDSLVKYYKEVDPSKQNLEDIAAWAMVHGLQPLSERLEKRYGKGLLPKEDELDPITLRLRLRQFYQIHDDKPKSDEDLDTILSWVLAGSISQLNIKLQQKYGANLTDLPPLEVGEKVFVPVKGAAAAAPLAAKSGLPQAPPPTNSTPKAPQVRGGSPPTLLRAPYILLAPAPRPRGVRARRPGGSGCCNGQAQGGSGGCQAPRASHVAAEKVSPGLAQARLDALAQRQPAARGAQAPRPGQRRGDGLVPLAGRDGRRLAGRQLL
jgi:hypothetical protein